MGPRTQTARCRTDMHRRQQFWSSLRLHKCRKRPRMLARWVCHSSLRPQFRNRLQPTHPRPHPHPHLLHLPRSINPHNQTLSHQHIPHQTTPTTLHRQHRQHPILPLLPPWRNHHRSSLPDSPSPARLLLASLPLPLPRARCPARSSLPPILSGYDHTGQLTTPRAATRTLPTSPASSPPASSRNLSPLTQNPPRDGNRRGRRSREGRPFTLSESRVVASPHRIVRSLSVMSSPSRCRASPRHRKRPVLPPRHLLRPLRSRPHPRPHLRPSVRPLLLPSSPRRGRRCSVRPSLPSLPPVPRTAFRLLRRRPCLPLPSRSTRCPLRAWRPGSPLLMDDRRRGRLPQPSRRRGLPPLELPRRLLRTLLVCSRMV